MNTNTNRRMYTERTPRSINIYAMNNTTQQPSTVITNCLYCSKEFSFYPPSRNRRYCSRKCSGIHAASKRPSLTVTANCKICNKEFSFFQCQKAKYCSMACRAKGRIKPGTAERRKQYALEHKEYNSIKAKECYERNKERYKEKGKERRKDPEHKKRTAEYRRNYLKDPKNKERMKEYYKVYNELTKDRRNELTRALYRKYIKDPKHKIKRKLRNRLYSALKAKNAEKQLSAIALVGCSIEDLKKHIESQWLPGMTWENHTINGWHIDHIMPCNTFDLRDLEQQKICFHYTNLRPLWGSDNVSRPHNGSDL